MGLQQAPWPTHVRYHHTAKRRRGSDRGIKSQELAMASQGALQLTETRPSLYGRGQISRFISQLPLQMLHTQYEIHPAGRTFLRRLLLAGPGGHRRMRLVALARREAED